MTVICILLSVLSGFALTAQNLLNSGLKVKMGSTILSALINFVVAGFGLLLIFLVFLTKGKINFPSMCEVKNINIFLFTGGLMGTFYIASTIFSSNKIGFANMFSLIICGQIILSVILDQFGLFGSQIRSLNLLRILGVVLLVSGAYIIQKN